MALDKNQIAKRIAKELKNNTYVNLGIGIPTLVANYIPKGINVEFQSVSEANHFFSKNENSLVKYLDKYIKKETALY